MARKSTYLLTMNAIDLRQRRAWLIESICNTEAQLADLDRDLNATDAEIYSRMESVGFALLSQGRHLWMLADESPHHTYNTTAGPHDLDDELAKFDAADAPAPAPQAPSCSPFVGCGPIIEVREPREDELRTFGELVLGRFAEIDAQAPPAVAGDAAGGGGEEEWQVGDAVRVTADLKTLENIGCSSRLGMDGVLRIIDICDKDFPLFIRFPDGEGRWMSPSHLVRRPSPRPLDTDGQLWADAACVPGEGVGRG